MQGIWNIKIHAKNVLNPMSISTKWKEVIKFIYKTKLFALMEGVGGEYISE